MGDINYIPSDSGMYALSSNLDDLMKSMDGIHKQQETITNMLLDVDGTLIRHIDNPSEEMMLAAVKQNGMAIQHILPMKQTEEIKWAAIKNNPYCFEFVYEPSLTMWEEAVKFEYDEDDENIEKHPVHLIKNSNIKETVVRISLYTSFIDSNPYAFSYIIRDISSEKDKNIEALTWRHFLMHHDYTSCIKCPDDVMDQIVDDLINKNPCVLNRLHIKYWTVGRTKKLLKKSPSEIRNVPHSIFPDEIGELYRFASDNVKNGIDIIGIVLAFQSDNFREEIFPDILESKNIFFIINKGLFSFYNEFDKDKAMYIINKFGFDKLCKEVVSERVEKIINVLPPLTYLKYKFKLWKITKDMARKSLEKSTNEGDGNGDK